MFLRTGHMQFDLRAAKFGEMSVDSFDSILPLRPSERRTVSWSWNLQLAYVGCGNCDAGGSSLLQTAADIIGSRILFSATVSAAPNLWKIFLQNGKRTLK
jgi:hypothetical protein